MQPNIRYTNTYNKKHQWPLKKNIHFSFTTFLTTVKTDSE